jgi:hypothetical protein
MTTKATDGQPYNKAFLVVAYFFSKKLPTNFARGFNIRLDGIYAGNLPSSLGASCGIWDAWDNGDNNCCEILLLDAHKEGSY